MSGSQNIRNELWLRRSITGSVREVQGEGSGLKMVGWRFLLLRHHKQFLTCVTKNCCVTWNIRVYANFVLNLLAYLFNQCHITMILQFILSRLRLLL